MKRILAICGFWLLVGSAFSQPVTYDAVKFTDLVIESSWKTVESVVPVLLAGVKTQLETGGATKEAAKVLTEELQKSFTKENFARGYSKQLAEKFGAEEISALSAFYSSSVGKKFLEFSSSDDQNQKVVQYILKATCDSVKQKLGFFDRGSINSTCGKF
jgi:hypothetical protein